MLQWMGGSRRKVATSRKSTEKRQKQYFEQKRRQQHQQMDGVESYCEEKKICEQNQKEHRSLDVLTLLNLSRDSPLCKPANVCPCDNHHKHNAGFSKVNSSEVPRNFSKDAPVKFGDSFSPTDSPEIREGHCLGNQAENASPKKVLVTAAENHHAVSGGVERVKDFQETATQKKLSVFDLVDDDDGVNFKTIKSPAHEAHVAFSVDGLGNVGAETPVQSPQRPDRYGSYDYFAPSKAARPNNVKIHNDFEREVEVMMQDIGLPPSINHFDFSKTDQLHGKFKNSPTSRDHGQLDSHYRDTSSSYRDKIKPHRQNNFDLCDASPTLLDEDFVDENDSFWSSLPHGTHDESAHLKFYGSTGLEDYSFEGSHVQRKKRSCIKEVDEYDVSGELGSFALKYQASKSEYDFLHSRKARKSSMEDVILEPVWSPHIIEDPRDHVSLLSEESSSSTAVRHASMDTSTSYPTERHRRKHENPFDGHDTTIYGASSIEAGDRHQKKWGNSHKRGQRYMSGRSPPRPTLLDPDLGNDFDPLLKEKRGRYSDWPYEEGYKDFNNVHHGSEANHPSSFVSKPWNEDLSDAFPVHRDHQIDPIAPEPSGAKHLYDSPTYSFPKVKLPTSPDFKFDERTPKFCKDDDFFHGEWSMPPNLSPAQETVSNAMGYNKPQCHRGNDGNMEGLDDIASDFGENVKDGAAALETSSSVNIPEKSNATSIDDEVEVAGGHRKQREAARVPPPNNARQSDNNADVEHEGFVRRKTVTRMDKYGVVSSPQVMMLESYVVQLLSVQKTARRVY